MDVSLINAYHRQAMIQCDYAIICRRIGYDRDAQEYFRIAFEYERDAAEAEAKMLKAGFKFSRAMAIQVNGKARELVTFVSGA